MWAMKIQASADAMDFSQSLASRRQRPSQAKVRSTTQRRGRTSNPLRRVRALDDFEGPVAELAQGVVQLRPGIAAVGEDVTQPRPAGADGVEHHRCAIAILDTGGVDYHADQQTERVGDDVPLPALDLLAGGVGEVLKLLEIGLGCRPAGGADDHHRRLPPAAAGSTPRRREYRGRCALARR
jgi:hypothetical protein